MPKKNLKFRYSSTYYRKKAKLDLLEDGCKSKTLIEDPFPNQIFKTSNPPPPTQSHGNVESEPSEGITEHCYQSSDGEVCDTDDYFENEMSEHFGDSDDVCSTDFLRNALRSWALESSISFLHLNRLLGILTASGIKNLPKDGRTLLETPKHINIESINETGEFWYHGIENCLKPLEYPENTELKLNFHFDGLPIGKSSKRQFWPILLDLINVPEVSEPFVLAIYSGEGKPGSAEIFLKQFVTELKYLMENGLTNIQDKKLDIKINAIICDTPARSFVKCTVSHNAYYSCMKCVVEGEYDKGGRHISFPQTDCRTRTDDDFRKRRYIEHHQIDKTTNQILSSPLEQLPIDMVKDFPIADSLHLIDLGIVKRCLKGWVHGSYNFRTKFFASQINTISAWLKECNKYLPSDIHRSVRGLDCLSFWKATEFRTFLLYLGIVVLKDNLSEEIYKHFLLLFSAVTILSSEKYVAQENYVTAAEEMLIDYIECFISIYGQDSVSSNVHNLCHVVDDVKRFGCLPNLSTYKFENQLGKIKNMLRSGNRPLAQVAKRIMERSSMSRKVLPKQTASFKHATSELAHGTDVHFKTVLISGILFQNDNKNQWFLTKNNEVVKMISAFGPNDEPQIFGTSIKQLDNFFIYPLQSKNLNIYSCKKIFNEPCNYSSKSIKCKLAGVHYKNECYVFFPLLHTLDLFS